VARRVPTASGASPRSPQSPPREPYVLHQRSANGQVLPGEPEAVSVQATYVVGLGWDLTISIRRQFQTWAESSRGQYERLTTPEMVTVVDAALSSELRV